MDMEKLSFFYFILFFQRKQRILYWKGEKKSAKWTVKKEPLKITKKDLHNCLLIADQINYRIYKINRPHELKTKSKPKIHLSKPITLPNDESRLI